MASPLANIKPSPAVKMAARLYATGACKTKKAASEAAGLHPNYLTMLTSPTNGNDEVKRIITEVDRMIADKTVDTSVVLEHLGRKALGKINQLMDNSASEHIQLKAAQDLADRAHDTAKTQRLQVDAFTLSGHDAKELAAALVESARERETYMHAAEGLVEIDVQARTEVPDFAKALSSRPKEIGPAPEAINASPTEREG